jgi:hypothetical protein
MQKEEIEKIKQAHGRGAYKAETNSRMCAHNVIPSLVKEIERLRFALESIIEKLGTEYKLDHDGARGLSLIAQMALWEGEK